VRIDQFHCENNEVSELSVLRHKEGAHSRQSAFALKEAADAHNALEARATAGSGGDDHVFSRRQT
jgi:hypothetical protein